MKRLFRRYSNRVFARSTAYPGLVFFVLKKCYTINHLVEFVKLPKDS